jgi:hypothetical protein
VTRFRAVVTIAAVLALSLSACQASFSTANISSAKLATGPAGENPTTTFAPNQTFYYVVDLANAPDDTRVRSVWSVDDVPNSGVEPGHVIDEASVETGSNQLHFDLAPDGTWLPGTYKVELYLDEGKEPVESAVATVE